MRTTRYVETTSTEASIVLVTPCYGQASTALLQLPVQTLRRNSRNIHLLCNRPCPARFSVTPQAASTHKATGSARVSSAQERAELRAPGQLSSSAGSSGPQGAQRRTAAPQHPQGAPHGRSTARILRAAPRSSRVPPLTAKRLPVATAASLRPSLAAGLRYGSALPGPPSAAAAARGGGTAAPADGDAAGPSGRRTRIARRRRCRDEAGRGGAGRQGALRSVLSIYVTARERRVSARGMEGGRPSTGVSERRLRSGAVLLGRSPAGLSGRQGEAAPRRRLGRSGGSCAVRQPGCDAAAPGSSRGLLSRRCGARAAAAPSANARRRSGDTCGTASCGSSRAGRGGELRSSTGRNARCGSGRGGGRERRAAPAAPRCA